MTLVTDAALPPLDYEQETDPEQVHRLIATARAESPIAMGPHGPELLSYDLVRAALRRADREAAQPALRRPRPVEADDRDHRARLTAGDLRSGLKVQKLDLKCDRLRRAK